LYFASLREKIGKDSEELSGFDNLKALKKELKTKYGAFADNILTAVNLEIANDENIALNENDEIAFYPPVTGG
jgi:molybdopterin synthase sulfur carrier subunit